MAAPSAERRVAPAAQGGGGEIVIALEAREPEAPPPDLPAAPGEELGGELGAGFRTTVIGPGRDALRALLEEADRRSARAAVLLRAGTGDGAARTAAALVRPALASSLDWVCAARRRRKLDGMLNTAIVSPLLRALFGRRVHQPCAGEAALSLGLVRGLLAAPGWGHAAGSGAEAWLAAAALAGPWRVGEAWLGPWSGAAPAPEDASHALARAVAPVFEEMARHADRWQRVEGSEPVPSFGEAGVLDGGAAAGAAGLGEAFRLGLRELGPLWGHVLPAATLLALGRAAAAPPGAARVDDATWARIVYDFGLAFSLRTVERQQLLRSMTPLYLGWVAGFAADVGAGDGEATAARAEALCAAFEREKPYAIARWRWPDGFNP